jgi:hypothetical protein
MWTGRGCPWAMARQPFFRPSRGCPFSVLPLFDSTAAVIIRAGLTTVSRLPALTFFPRLFLFILLCSRPLWRLCTLLWFHLLNFFLRVFCLCFFYPCTAVFRLPSISSIICVASYCTTTPSLLSLVLSLPVVALSAPLLTTCPNTAVFHCPRLGFVQLHICLFFTFAVHRLLAPVFPLFVSCSYSLSRLPLFYDAPTPVPPITSHRVARSFVAAHTLQLLTS